MADDRKPVAAKLPAEDIDPDNLKLSPEKLEAIKLKARSIVAKERMAALEKIALDAALEEIRGKEGQITGNPIEDELVNIAIDTSLSTDRIVVNGRAFFHGQSYTVPRHVARSLMETMYRLAMHEHSITDKPLSAFYQKPRHTVVSKRGTQNAPRSPGEGLPMPTAAH